MSKLGCERLSFSVEAALFQREQFRDQAFNLIVIVTFEVILFLIGPYGVWNCVKIKDLEEIKDCEAIKASEEIKDGEKFKDPEESRTAKRWEMAKKLRLAKRSRMTKKLSLWTSREEIKDRDAIMSCEKSLDCGEFRDHVENKNYHAIKAA